MTFSNRRPCLISHALVAGCLVLIILWNQPSVPEVQSPPFKQIEVINYAATRSITQSERYQSRLDLVKVSCKDRNTTDVAKNPSDFLIVNEKHEIIYCNIPKVACTSWKKLLLIDNDIDISQAKDDYEINEIGRESLNYLHKYNLTRRRYILENYKKFLFVRDPFTRLLSAYQNKLSPESRFSNESSHTTTFTDIGLSIIGLLHGQGLEERVRADISLYNVSFSEFIHYLVDASTKEYDRHWERFHKLCLPCDIDYDFIGKLETLDKDLDYILNLTGINIPFPRSEKSTNSSFENTVREYYRLVPKTDIKKLYEIFSFDFKLFGYSPSTFTGLDFV